MNSLLGRQVDIGGRNVKIGFLRGDCDAGVVDRHYDCRSADGIKKSLLVRLSTLTIIRELEPDEDYDAAVLAARK